MASASPTLSDLLQGAYDASIDNLIDTALAEDLGAGDVTTEATIPSNVQATGRFLVKADGVIAGLQVAEKVFAKVDATCKLKWTHKDGDFVKAGTLIGTVDGSAHSLLIAERLALNIMQRMGGIATATRKMMDAVQPHKAKILDTRKTAPGLRILDKIAVKMGGGENHRIGLYDMVLVKDNHVTVAGGIKPAVAAVKKHLEKLGLVGSIPVEIETRTLDEVKEALSVDDFKIDRLMLDNMVKVTRDENGKVTAIDTSVLRTAVDLIGGKLVTEASGNVTLETVNAIAASGVDFISSGSMTHSVIALDISMKITVHT